MLKERAKRLYFYRHTFWEMALSQLKAKYSGSILGIFWAVINPILLMLVINFVFTKVFAAPIKNFALFVLSGIIPWMFFSSALADATLSIVNQQNIIRQFNLPREIIPLSSVLANFLNFMIGWLIIYPLFWFFNPRIILYLPLLVICLGLTLLFTLGLSLMFSVLNVVFRDLGQLLGILLMLWFWMTPVFYSIDMVPGRFRFFCNLNPMTPYIIYYRDVLFEANPPAIAIFASTFVLAVAVLFLGWRCFLVFEHSILKRL